MRVDPKQQKTGAEAWHNLEEKRMKLTCLPLATSLHPTHSQNIPHDHTAFQIREITPFTLWAQGFQDWHLIRHASQRGLWTPERVSQLRISGHLRRWVRKQQARPWMWEGPFFSPVTATPTPMCLFSRLLYFAVYNVHFWLKFVRET